MIKIYLKNKKAKSIIIFFLALLPSSFSAYLNIHLNPLKSNKHVNKFYLEKTSKKKGKKIKNKTRKNSK